MNRARTVSVVALCAIFALSSAAAEKPRKIEAFGVFVVADASCPPATHSILGACLDNTCQHPRMGYATFAKPFQPDLLPGPVRIVGTLEPEICGKPFVLIRKIGPSQPIPCPPPEGCG